MDQRLVVMSGLAVRAALEQRVFPAFEAETGIVLDVSWEPTTVIMKALEEGAPVDVIIVTDEAIDDLVRRKLAEAASMTRVANAVLGLAVKKGAPRPDIGTVHACRAALVGARSVAYSKAGASGIYFEGLIDQMGVGDLVRQKSTLIPKGFTAEKLVTGEADLAIQQISELMLIDGVDIIGPLPAAIQSTTGFTAAVSTATTWPAQAARLLAALVSEQAVQAYRASGLVPR